MRWRLRRGLRADQRWCQSSCVGHLQVRIVGFEVSKTDPVNRTSVVRLGLADQSGSAGRSLDLPTADSHSFYHPAAPLGSTGRVLAYLQSLVVVSCNQPLFSFPSWPYPRGSSQPHCRAAQPKWAKPHRPLPPRARASVIFSTSWLVARLRMGAGGLSQMVGHCPGLRRPSRARVACPWTRSATWPGTAGTDSGERAGGEG